MPELVVDGDRRQIVARDARLVFDWTGSRWIHSLETRQGSESAYQIRACSLESDPERDESARVVSPAYQDLHFQEVGETFQALLVGQSGPHHFSAVFSVVDEIFGDVSIQVDVADRCRATVEAFASTYTVNATSNELANAGAEKVSWDFGSNRLSFVARPPAQVALAEAGRQATSVQALAGLKAEPGSATHRLLYSWHWC